MLITGIVWACITMTPQWARWRLKSPASPLFTQPFIGAQIKENIKAPRQWPLCGEFTGDRWIPRTNGQLRFPPQMASYAENIFIWWRHHGRCTILNAASHHKPSGNCLHLICWVVWCLWFIIEYLWIFDPLSPCLKAIHFYISLQFKIRGSPHWYIFFVLKS